MRPALLLLALAAGCAGEGQGSTWQRIQERGEIRWGADVQGGEPYLYEDPDEPGRLVGFEVDVMEGVARRLGVKQRFVQCAWSNLVPSLERGDFDVAVNGLEDTAERRARILVSRPYYVYAETLAVRRGAAYRSLGDLRGRRVGTLNQTYAHDLLRDAGVTVVLYEGVEEPYRDLAAGRLDGVLLDSIIADRYGCPALGVECLPTDVALGTYIVGIRRADAELKTMIDRTLADMAADGELQRILAKHGIWDHRQAAVPTAASVAAPRHDERWNAGQLRLFLAGAGMTLLISCASFALAVPLGLLLALGRLYGGAPVRAAARVYIEVFRGTPVLLQLYVLYYGLAPYYSLGPITAAVLGLGLNYAAYEAEIYRGALLAVPRGQSEASRALGLSPWQQLRHVLVPQAFRVALPPMTNDFVALLKDSSLVGVITVIELTKRMTIAAVDMRGWLVPGLACAALYLAMSLPLSELARWLERRLVHDQHPRAV